MCLGQRFLLWASGSPFGQEIADAIQTHHNEGLGSAIRDYWNSFVATGTPTGIVAWPQFTDVLMTPALLTDQHRSNSPRFSVSFGGRRVKCAYVNRFKGASQNNAVNLLKLFARGFGNDSNPLPPTRVPAYENHPVVI